MSTEGVSQVMWDGLQGMGSQNLFLKYGLFHVIIIIPSEMCNPFVKQKRMPAEVIDMFRLLLLL